jgi:hypothetical protein
VTWLYNFLAEIWDFLTGFWFWGFFTNFSGDHIPLTYSLGFLYFGLRLLAQPFMFLDVYRMAIDGRLPYLDALKFLPEKINYYAFKPQHIVRVFFFSEFFFEFFLLTWCSFSLLLLCSFLLFPRCTLPCSLLPALTLLSPRAILYLLLAPSCPSLVLPPFCFPCFILFSPQKKASPNLSQLLDPRKKIGKKIKHNSGARTFFGIHRGCPGVRKFRGKRSRENSGTQFGCSDFSRGIGSCDNKIRASRFFFSLRDPNSEFFPFPIFFHINFRFSPKFFS